MVSLDKYMYDGANEQAVAVMAFLRAKYGSILSKSFDKNNVAFPFKASLRVGRYENCREQGYVFSLCYNANQKNYAVYEHRNSDNIIVLISNKVTLNTPSIDIMWGDKGENPSKYDYDKSFGYGEILECAEWLEEDMKETLDKWLGV